MYAAALNAQTADKMEILVFMEVTNIMEILR
jgi:hypothetical protein